MSERARAVSAPIRVLLACDHIDHDGALHGGGRQLVELTQALDHRRVEPTLCVVRAPSELGLQLRREGLPLRFFGLHPADPRVALHFARVIRLRRIDVLHVTDFGASTYGRLVGALTRTPVIVHVRTHHSEFQPKGYPPYVEAAYKAMAPLTARIIANSNSVRDFSIERMGFRPEKVEVLNNPLARFSFAPPPENSIQGLRARYGLGDRDPVIGAVTRFHAAKGIEYLIAAFPKVLSTHPGTWLVLVGEGPEGSRLRALAKEINVSERVIFAGFQREPQAFFSLFDVCVVPSLEEGFGNVAVESLAMGTPVVASRTGGLPEIISDGETGYLVEPRDPSAIARSVGHLLADADLRARMGEAAKLASQDFSMDRYMDRLERIYDSVAAPGRST